MQNHLFSLRRGILALAVVVFFGYILHQNVPFNGHKNFEYLLGEPHPLMGVWPGQGVSHLYEEEGIPFRNLTKDSLYLDLKTPVRYRSIKVSLMVRKTHSGVPEFGVRVPPGDWHYRRVTLQKEGQRGDWEEYSGLLDLTDAQRINDKYVLLLHFSGGATKAESDMVQVSSFHFTLERDPLSLARIWQKLITSSSLPI